MKDEILTLLSDDDYMDRSIDLLAKRLDCFSSENFVKLVKIMNELEEAGKVIRNKYNHYYLPNQFGMVLGTLTINKKGYGFINPDGEEKDVFVHIMALEKSGLRSLSEGSRVNFDIYDDRGRKAAGNITLLN